MAADPSDPDLIETIKARWQEARTHAADWRADAREDYGFVDGSGQWDEADRQVLRDQLRPVITFNRVGPVIDAVIGSEVNNRQEVRYIPREAGDGGVNEVLTGAAQWVRESCDAEDEETDAFFDTIVCGMGWTETRLDYESDADGRILIERVDPFEMYWDPAARKRNLSDARWLIRVKDIDRGDLEALWPETAPEVAGPGGDPWGDGDGAGKPHVVSSGDRYADGDGSAPAAPKAKYRVVEYQWWEREPVYRVADPLAGAIAELGEGEFETLMARARKLGFEPAFVRQMRRRYKRAFVCGHVVLEEGDSPCPDAFTYKAITGKRDQGAGTWYGLVRAMKDPQRWANKWLSQVLHVINSNAKGGLLAERDAFDNIRKAEADWADPTAITFLRPGGLGKVQPKPPIAYPAGLDKLMEFAIASIRDVTGVNLEMLGLADRQQAGVLEYQRKQAGLAILAPLFDSLRRYRKEQGRVLLHFIQAFVSDGRLVRIVGPEGERYVPLVKTAGAAAYDIIVDEAPTSPNQKERVFAVLTQLLPVLLNAGVAPPPEILDYTPLPESLARRWKQRLVEAGAGPAPGAVERQAEEARRLIRENQRLRLGVRERAAKDVAEAILGARRQDIDAALESRKQDIDAALQVRRQDAAARLAPRRNEPGNGFIN